MITQGTITDLTKPFHNTAKILENSTKASRSFNIYQVSSSGTPTSTKMSFYLFSILYLISVVCMDCKIHFNFPPFFYTSINKCSHFFFLFHPPLFSPTCSDSPLIPHPLSNSFSTHSLYDKQYWRLKETAATHVNPTLTVQSALLRSSLMHCCL